MEVTRDGLRYGQCRCCLSFGYHRGVFSENHCDGVREVYSDIFLDCFNLFLSTNSQISELICSSCVGRLRDANAFKTLVVASEKQLLAYVDHETTFINVPALQQNCLADGLDPPVKVELDSVKEEAPDDHGDDNNGGDHMDFSCNDDTDDDNSQVVSGNVKVDMEDFTLDAVRLINRYSVKRLRRLPTRDDLYIICPGYVRHLDRLKDKTVTGEMVRTLLEEPTAKTVLNPTLKTVCLSEKLAHITNAYTLIAFSNVAIFKSKSKSGFPCFFCKKVFEDLHKLREHQTETHKNSETKKLLSAYGTESLVVYAEITDLQCTICEASIPSLNELKSHLVKVHKKKMYPEFPDRVIPFRAPVNNLFRCEICTTTFETFGSIERHMNVHYNNYVCEECGTGFVTQYRLKVHLKGSHEEGNFTCEQCGKVFTTAQKLKNHIDGVHKAYKKHKCPICQERFNEYFKRQKHMVKVHGSAELQYKCNVCDRIFDRRYALSRHMKRDHLEERNFQCETCPYTCFTKNELRTHMVKHTGERIFECLVCKKSYARKKTLTEHMKIHNNDRRFVCVVCGQAFVQKCSLKGHMKTHHDTTYV